MYALVKLYPAHRLGSDNPIEVIGVGTKKEMEDLKYLTSHTKTGKLRNNSYKLLVRKVKT